MHILDFNKVYLKNRQAMKIATWPVPKNRQGKKMNPSEILWVIFFTKNENRFLLKRTHITLKLTEKAIE